MKTASHLRCCALAATLLPAIALSQATDKLALIQTIPLPNVQGRLDHLEVNPVSKRLYVAALESGSVEVVDLAVEVAVSCVHRAEAFHACHALIDRLKQEVPIWKRQWFRDGSSEWVGGA